MPEPLQEPEFLPDWYRTRVSRSRQRRTLICAAALFLLAGAAGAAFAPRRAPAEATPSRPHPIPTVTATVGPGLSQPNPSASAQVPPGARRALQALHESLPPHVTVDQLAFRHDRGLTHLSLSCSTADAGAGAVLADALRASPLFADIHAETHAKVIGKGSATHRPAHTFHFTVRATVAAEAQ